MLLLQSAADDDAGDEAHESRDVASGVQGSHALRTCPLLLLLLLRLLQLLDLPLQLKAPQFHPAKQTPFNFDSPILSSPLYADYMLQDHFNFFLFFFFVLGKKKRRKSFGSLSFPFLAFVISNGG